MSTELALPTDLTPAKYGDDVFDSLAFSGGDWLPYIQLVQGGAKVAKQGLFPPGHYALREGKGYKDLGVAFDCYVLANRPKAMRFGESVTVCYDPTDPVFQEIAKESGVKESDCQAGNEFLIYIPSVKKFAGFFMASKSAKPEAPKLRALQGKAATLATFFNEKGKFAWHSPVVKPQSAPIGEAPSADKLREEMEKFINPPESKTEVAPVEGAERER